MGVVPSSWQQGTGWEIKGNKTCCPSNDPVKELTGHSQKYCYKKDNTILLRLQHNVLTHGGVAVCWAGAGGSFGIGLVQAFKRRCM